MLRLSRLIVIFIVFLSATAVAAQGLSLDGIRYGGNAGKTRIVLDLSRQPVFRAFLLADPARIVVDIPGVSWKIARSRFISDEIVKSYRSGALEGGVTRIIFDLRKTAIISGAFTLPKDGLNKDRLVIDVQPASQNLFTARLEDVFGDRNLRGTGAPLPANRDASGFREMQNRLAAEAAPAALLQQSTLPLKKPQKAAPLAQEARKYTIIIDPGHGGEDPGALGGDGTREKNITLATAKQLKRQLEETGRYRVFLTREQDRYIRLRERLAFARKKNGDLFISLHADKIGRKNVRGASIYTLSEKASDAETARLADEENRAGVVAGVDLSEESADVADILLDLAMREKMNESNLLARFLGDALQSKKIRLLPNSHRSAGFAVLKAPDVPSALIEMGFLSNAEEVKLLSSGQFQRKIAEAIIGGIDAYFRKIEALRKI